MTARDKRILFISGSVGLGHVTRDVAIVNSLRNLDGEIEVDWLSEDPASSYLRSQGEVLLPECQKAEHGNRFLKGTDGTYELNVMRWFMRQRKEMGGNASMILELVSRNQYDLVVGDEAFDLTFEFWAHPDKKTFPFLMIYDCFGADAMSSNPKDRFFTWYINRIWAKFLQTKPKVADRFLFVGEPEDIDDRSLGVFLSNRRRVGREYLDFVGNIIRFDPSSFQDRAAVRRRLGLEDGPLVLCTKGGTEAGKVLLDLCSSAFPLAKELVPGLQMVVVCGPSIDPHSVKTHEGMTVLGFEPRMYEYIAASDLVVAQGGHTTINEIMALRRPFIAFPLANHFDQSSVISCRCGHPGALSMDFNNTTPETLAKAIRENIGRNVAYPPLSFDQGQRAASLIHEVVKGLGD